METNKPNVVQPMPLKPYSLLKLLSLFADVMLCLTPISFNVLAVLAKGLDRDTASQYGENIKQWTLLSPTIFPLGFAAVVGRSLQNIARYKLERGSYLKVS